MIQDTDNEYARWNKLGTQVRGRILTRDEFRNNAVGHSWLRAIEILSDDPEAERSLADQNVGRMARRDNWEGQIVGSLARIKELENVLAVERGRTATSPQEATPTQEPIDNKNVNWLVRILIQMFDKKK